ncbi:putative toxin-antitoxin system toxin component, PIN family [Leptospira bandrabouensis]|uniref:putative toxin-antitoxin system toxin component, PIN family n=1 Tax=Leptospira bandrabouensis TaxID=2484903 RepID=UPI00223DA94F|nr:putative toxin-antitoxin system toxin component, PIN family [Leptospira bandrabouensis]MCW7460401.1 putative toxin-antitoxin system toxin component, PIN family [Leptospira bandrabouensis]MCW7479377.1 putative toxin-antitoxin system toxin component, PIN family [Leptospira bandrabouensis]MCW7487043.1 putative toxin-antitoxin system toxin component, PIN family [Leptospira bandrabouensis]
MIYQALRDNRGASHFILKLVENRRIELALSTPVFTEYSDVLLRDKSLSDLALSKKDINLVLDFLAFVATPFSINYLLRPNLSDENDNLFVELAFASNSRYLITSNIKDFNLKNELKFDSFKVITPTDFAKFWRLNYE